jgi:translation initiation factor IF-1
LKILSEIYLKVLSHKYKTTMVKNTTGGNNNKKFARKHAAGSGSKAGAKLRVSENEGELYAICTKLLGNNMFHAVATDGLLYLVHIRGKFSGRGKRDNMIAGGSWVLIGLREWSNAAPKNGKVKAQETDICEVYTDADKVRLKDAVDADWDVLLANDPTRINKEEDKTEDEIHWQTEKDKEKARLLEELKAGTTAKISLVETTTTATSNPVFDLEVYVDDI